MKDKMITEISRDDDNYECYTAPAGCIDWEDGYNRYEAYLVLGYTDYAKIVVSSSADSPGVAGAKLIRKFENMINEAMSDLKTSLMDEINAEAKKRVGEIAKAFGLDQEAEEPKDEEGSNN